MLVFAASESVCVHLSLCVCVCARAVSLLPGCSSSCLTALFICFCFVSEAHQEPKWIWKHLRRCPPRPPHWLWATWSRKKYIITMICQTDEDNLDGRWNMKPFGACQSLPFFFFCCVCFLFQGAAADPPPDCCWATNCGVEQMSGNKNKRGGIAAVCGIGHTKLTSHVAWKHSHVSSLQLLFLFYAQTSSQKHGHTL